MATYNTCGHNFCIKDKHVLYTNNYYSLIFTQRENHDPEIKLKTKYCNKENNKLERLKLTVNCTSDTSFSWEWRLQPRGKTVSVTCRHPWGHSGWEGWGGLDTTATPWTGPAPGVVWGLPHLQICNELEELKHNLGIADLPVHKNTNRKYFMSTVHIETSVYNGKNFFIKVILLKNTLHNR